MAIFRTYSKRKRGMPDVFTYDKIDKKLKNQIFHIWTDYFVQEELSKELIKLVQRKIFETICKEEGKKSLYFNGTFLENSPDSQVENYFDKLLDTDKILDVIEITFFYISKLEKSVKQQNPDLRISYTSDNAIDELNFRFKENGVGYEFTNEQIIRIDNKLLHKETIQTALELLTDGDYQNANEEFLRAHEHFRFKRNQECLNECLKSFETTMKIVCQKNGWNYKETDTAKPLINNLISNSFFENYHESYLSAFRQLLESNIPTMCNKNSSHGQGIKKITVPNSLANYMLYTTGATINLIVDTQKNLERKKSE
jgi:hypothetical protein